MVMAGLIEARGAHAQRLDRLKAIEWGGGPNS